MAPHPQVHEVILVAGGIMPAEFRYAPLLEALGSDVRAVTKDLEVYIAPQVPEDHSIDAEVEGITRVADAEGFGRFHLYGYSGGASAGLAYVAEHPERILSLTMDHPATDFSDEHLAETREKYLPLTELPPDRFLRAFFAGGVEPPPEEPTPESQAEPEPEPEWMSNRPAGLRAFIRAIANSRVPIERLDSFEGPVYFIYGALSAAGYEPMRDRLASRFSDFESEAYEGASEWESPNTLFPDRVAAALKRLWTNAERART